MQVPEHHIDAHSASFLISARAGVLRYSISLQKPTPFQVLKAIIDPAGTLDASKPGIITRVVAFTRLEGLCRLKTRHYTQ